MRGSNGETIARSTAFVRMSAPPLLAAFERAHPEYAAMSVEERSAYAHSFMPVLQELMGDSPVVAQARAAKRAPDQLFFYHFAMTMDQCVAIHETRDMVALNKCMINAGGACDKRAFEQLSDNAFAKNIEKQINSSLYTIDLIGSVEIVLTHDNDVKRLCFMGIAHDNAPEKKERLVKLLSPVFPDAAEQLDDQAMRFLDNPTGDAAMLAAVLAEVRLKDPAAAAQVQKELGLWKSMCANCNAVNVRLTQCARCKEVRYCNVECQRAHWVEGRHKESCVQKK